MRFAYKSVFLSFVVSLFFLSSAFSADKYVIDTDHTNIGFSVRHLGISNVRGKFKVFSGVIMLDEKNPANCSVEADIQVASVDTDNDKRDAHLKSGDFFEVEKYPAMTFKSKQIKKTKGGYVAIGTFSMHGVAKEIRIPFTIQKATDPGGKSRIGIEAGLIINRQDYGVKWNKVIDNGGLVVGNDVKIELLVEAVK